MRPRRAAEVGHRLLELLIVICRAQSGALSLDQDLVIAGHEDCFAPAPSYWARAVATGLLLHNAMNAQCKRSSEQFVFVSFYFLHHDRLIKWMNCAKWWIISSTSLLSNPSFYSSSFSFGWLAEGSLSFALIPLLPLFSSLKPFREINSAVGCLECRLCARADVLGRS